MNSQLEPELGLSQALRAAGRSKYKLIAATLIPTILIYVIVGRMTPLYQSETMMLVQGESRNVAQELGSAFAGLVSDEITVNSQVHVLRSPAQAETVLFDQGLDADENFRLRATGLIGRMIAVFTRTQAQIPKELLIEQYLEDLNVNVVPDSRVITVQFRAASGDQAAQVANAIVDSYLGRQLSNKVENIRRSSRWIDERVTELRGQVEVSEAEVERIRAESNLAEADGNSLLAQTMTGLGAGILQARASLAEATARLAQVEKLAENPGQTSSASEVLDSTLIQRLREQETQVRRRLAETSPEYGSLHPRVVNLRAEAADLAIKVDQEIDKIVAGLRNEVEIARARLQSLTGDMRILEQRLASDRQKQVQLNSLEREVDASRNLLRSLLDRQREMSAQASAELSPDATVISRATPATMPSFPKQVQATGLAFFGFSFLSFAWLMVFDLSRQGLRSGDEVEASLGVYSLGLIPHIKTKRGETPISTVANNSRSAIAQSCRNVFWHLMMSGPTGRGMVIMVTSAKPESGKTTISSCLATVCQHMDKKALLIDADSMRPAIHDEFNLKRKPGLMDALTGDADIKDIITRSRGIDVITAGSPVTNAGSLLTSSLMDTIIRVSVRKYDLVVIDTPPMMVSMDARLISTMVDQAVIVGRWGQSSATEFKHVIRLLGEDVAISVLLNMVDASKHAKDQYGDSGYFADSTIRYYQT